MSKITSYEALPEAEDNDELVIVDVNDTTMAPTGTTKKITVGDLLADYPVLDNQNYYTATQYFLPPTGANVVANAFTGRNGGFSYGIDAAASIPSRDFFLGRVEQPLDDTDLLYIQHNAQTATLTSAVSAGATSLPISAALTFTGTDGSSNYWAMIGDNTTGNTQEWVKITAGQGTTTMTCSPLVHPHPSGALVTVGYDYANQPTFELFRAGSAASSNKNWQLTLRPDITGYQPTLGALKIEIPPSPGLAADFAEIASRDESEKIFRVQVDGSASHESVPANWSDAAGATNSNTTVGLSITPSDDMYGCFITGSGIYRGTYITAVDIDAKTVTISTAATATATDVSLYIYKPAFQVRQNADGGYQPYLSVTDGGFVIRGKMMVGSAGTAGAGIPSVDLHIAGTGIYLNPGGSYPDFIIVSDSSGGGMTHLQPWGITALSFSTSGESPKLGFFATTPVVQPDTTGTTTGFSAGSGTAVLEGSTFTGDTGSTAYTIGDIVLALKTLGLLTS